MKARVKSWSDVTVLQEAADTDCSEFGTSELIQFICDWRDL